MSFKILFKKVLSKNHQIFGIKAKCSDFENGYKFVVTKCFYSGTKSIRNCRLTDTKFFGSESSENYNAHIVTNYGSMYND
jgi:hypothetical protein